MTQNGEKARKGGGGERRGHSSYTNEDGAEVDHTDGEMGSRSSSFSGSSPRSSVGSGGGGGSTTNVPSGRSLGSKKVSSSSLSDPSGRGGVQGIPGVALRPAVPFGASALSKTMPNSGRGRPRGLRPRSSSSLSSRTPGSAGVNGQRPFSASAVNPSSLGRQAGSGSSSARGGGGGRSGGGNALARRRSPSANFREAEARAAEAVAPGVPVDVVVASAIKIESVMRVLIARGYVRRKLVSEVTAFSLIMERGIEVIKVCACFMVHVPVKNFYFYLDNSFLF